MPDQDRTIKFTFTTEDKELLASFKEANEQAKELQANLSGIASTFKKHSQVQVNQDAKFDALGKAQDLADVTEKVLQYEKDKLAVFRKQRLELSGILRQQKSLASAGGGGAGGAAGGILGGGGKGGKGGLMGGGVAVLVKKALAVTVGAAAAAVASQMRLAYGAYHDYATAVGGLAGTGTTYDQMSYARTHAVKYGYTGTETAQQARAVAIQTGSGRAVNTAQMISRGTPLDVGQATGFMGSLTRAGHGFGGRGGVSGERKFKNAIALGFKSGIDDARLGEYLQGVDKVLTSQGARLGGDVDPMNAARLLQAMGATGASGLQGARGASVLAKLDASIVNPGGGEAGKAIMYQAMGFGKPGGNATYYEAKRRLQEGATPTNVRDIFAEFNAQHGGAQETNLALEEVTGLTLPIIEELQKAFRNQDPVKRDKEVADILKNTKSVEDRAADSMEEVGFHTKRISFLQNRLVNMGKIIYPNVVKMQDHLNRLVDKAYPAASAAAEVSVDVADEVSEGFPTWGNKVADWFESLGLPGRIERDQPLWMKQKEARDVKGSAWARDNLTPNQIANLNMMLKESSDKVKQDWNAALKTPQSKDDAEVLRKNFLSEGSPGYNQLVEMNRNLMTLINQGGQSLPQPAPAGQPPVLWSVDKP